MARSIELEAAMAEVLSEGWRTGNAWPRSAGRATGGQAEVEARPGRVRWLAPTDRGVRSEGGRSVEMTTTASGMGLEDLVNIGGSPQPVGDREI